MTIDEFVQAINVLLEITIGLAQPDFAVQVTLFLYIGPGFGVIIRTAHGDAELFHNGITGPKFADDIAWESEVWIADNPDHMIHFNGYKFLEMHQ